VLTELGTTLVLTDLGTTLVLTDLGTTLVLTGLALVRVREQEQEQVLTRIMMEQVQQVQRVQRVRRVQRVQRVQQELELNRRWMGREPEPVLSQKLGLHSAAGCW
jgi:2-methylisocitrate lyase-like PEP mutase family enzyme